MTNEEFTALVGRLEAAAQRDPGAYQSRALMLALAGNAYLAGIVALLLASIVGMVAMIAVLKFVAVKVAFVLGGFLLVVLRAAWIRLPPPQGIEVTRADAPRLFELIDGLRSALDAPPFHHVLVTDEFNAAVCQVPRFGVLAGTRNYLLLGLPMMMALTTEQFRAVLAHELGHLARGHGRIANWVYCQRRRWAQLASALAESESRGRWLFKPLLERFVPYFTAYSFPLARANEYEADAASVALTSPRVVAEALTAVNVYGAFLEQRYWPRVHGEAGELPQPRFMPFSNLRRGYAEDLDPAATGQWIEQSLARRTDLADTHPSLSDRLGAVGVAASFAPPADGESAECLLGQRVPALLDQLDRQWRDGVLPAWTERHEAVRAGRVRHAELEARLSAGDALDIDERVEHAWLTDSAAHDGQRSIDLLRAIVDEAPDHVGARYSLGIRLLARDDEAGAPLLEHLVDDDSSVAVPAAIALRDYAARRGRQQDAERWHRHAVTVSQRLDTIEHERSVVRLSDKFVRHDLDARQLAALQARIRALAGVKRAYLVRKEIPVDGGPMHHGYVLGLSLAGMGDGARATHMGPALESLQVAGALPAGTLILCVNGANYRFGRKFYWMRGARIR